MDGGPLCRYDVLLRLHVRFWFAGQRNTNTGTWSKLHELEFLFCCSQDCPSCSANAIQMARATLAICQPKRNTIIRMNKMRYSLGDLSY